MERVAVHPRSGGRIMTKQADALETDVNKIVARFVAHGELPNDGRTPTYGDYSNVDDYHTAMNKVRQAQMDFMDLPAAVRAHVENDPGKFLDLVHNPDRRGELEELGLVEAQAPESAPPAKEKDKTTEPDPAPAPAPAEG